MRSGEAPMGRVERGVCSSEAVSDSGEQVRSAEIGGDRLRAGEVRGDRSLPALGRRRQRSRRRVRSRRMRRAAAGRRRTGWRASLDRASAWPLEARRPRACWGATVNEAEGDGGQALWFRAQRLPDACASTWEAVRRHSGAASEAISNLVQSEAISHLVFVCRDDVGDPPEHLVDL